ncbi:MAG: hypothetical protein ACKVK8_03940, partial [Rhodospirillales bacterium]
MDGSRPLVDHRSRVFLQDADGEAVTEERQGAGHANRTSANNDYIEVFFQMTDPSRWIATQAAIFLPTLIGSTRQYMMKG